MRIHSPGGARVAFFVFALLFGSALASAQAPSAPPTVAAPPAGVQSPPSSAGPSTTEVELRTRADAQRDELTRLARVTEKLTSDLTATTLRQTEVSTVVDVAKWLVPLLLVFGVATVAFVRQRKLTKLEMKELVTDVVNRLVKVDSAEFDRLSTAVGAEVTARILSRRLAIHVLGEAAEAGQIQATLAQFGFNTVAKDLADAAIVIVLGEAALVTHGAALAARANSRRAFVSFTPRFLAPESPGGQVFAALSERSLATYANSPATVAMHVMTMATLLSPTPDLSTSTPTPK